jgi:hypothetical protein
MFVAPLIEDPGYPDSPKGADTCFLHAESKNSPKEKVCRVIQNTKLQQNRRQSPVPPSAIDCGLPGTVSFRLSVALRAPAALGVNVTLIVH